MAEKEEGNEYVICYRINFTEETSKFLKDYKQAYGVSIQHFVETAVNKHILETKIKEDLGEI